MSRLSHAKIGAFVDRIVVEVDKICAKLDDEDRLSVYELVLDTLEQRADKLAKAKDGEDEEPEEDEEDDEEEDEDLESLDEDGDDEDEKDGWLTSR